MLIKFTDAQLRTHYNGTIQQYQLGDWAIPQDGITSLPDGNACGPGGLHLMKAMRPIYAPYPWLAHEAEGHGLLGEDAEKARFQRVRLIHTFTDAEIDEAMDADWAARLGQSGLFMPLSWVRTATYLDRPVDKAMLQPYLTAFCKLVDKPETIRWQKASLEASLWASLEASLRASLRASLWDSLRASLEASLIWERALVLAGKPREELTGLLKVWQAGACPVGWSNNELIVLVEGQ